MSVQRQIEREWLGRLRRDIRNIEHLRYVQITPCRPPPDVRTVEEDMGECIICQEVFLPGHEYIVLQCNPTHPHSFHKECIRPWLRNHDTCPTCRGKV